MRRSRKPFGAVTSRESSNLSPSAQLGEIPGNGQTEGSTGPPSVPLETGGNRYGVSRTVARLSRTCSTRAGVSARRRNFAVWIAATAHGLGAGTDSGSTALLLIYALTAGILAVLALRRIAPKPAASPGTPTAASAGTRSRRTRA